MKYIDLKDAEKALIKRVDWNIEGASKRDLQIRNECLEALAQVNSIDIIDTPCKYCSPEYDQHIEAICVRLHKSSEESLHNIDVHFCPYCGRVLKG